MPCSTDTRRKEEKGDAYKVNWRYRTIEANCRIEALAGDQKPTVGFHMKSFRLGMWRSIVYTTFLEHARIRSALPNIAGPSLSSSLPTASLYTESWRETVCRIVQNPLRHLTMKSSSLPHQTLPHTLTREKTMMKGWLSIHVMDHANNSSSPNTTIPRYV